MVTRILVEHTVQGLSTIMRVVSPLNTKYLECIFEHSSPVTDRQQTALKVDIQST
jgi:hypothetical protein